MKRRILAIGAVLAAVTAGCSSSPRATPASTTTTPSSTTTVPATTTTTIPNPDVIPPVITVAYVNAVFAVLNHVYGNATRELAATRTVSPQVKADLRAIFGDALYAEQVSEANVSLQGAIANVRPDAGDGVTVVSELISATSDCIFVETSTDLSAVLIHETPGAASEYYELTPKPASIDPDHLNPTPWVMTFNVAYLTPTKVTSKCAAS